MKLFVLLAVVATVALAADDDAALHLFEDFKATFGKQYSPSESVTRFECFRTNLGRIQASSADQTEQATFGINQFADLCEDEFRSTFLGFKAPTLKNATKAALFASHEVNAALSGSVDWRAKGAVSHVKNQASCGSCWAFSAIGNIEGQNFLKTRKMQTLSEEELVQCAKNGNQGCQGGIMDSAFDWIKSNGGIDSESDYPYTSGSGVTGQCKTSKLSRHVVKITGHVDIAQDEAQMAAWVQKNGPMSIAVDAGTMWQLYTGGVKTSCTAGQPDHGVLIVGYGTTSSGVDYWIVKNSWGASWGESGYIRLKRGVNCNSVTSNPCSATV